jgi:hypothetical protein
MIYTRAQIRSQARTAADQDNSTFPTDTAYNEIIDRSADFVWRRMVAVGWKPNKLSTTITANGSAIVLPGQIATVDLIYPVASLSSTVPVGPPLRRVKIEEIPSLLSAASSSTQAVAYDLFSGVQSAAPSIQLYPAVTSGFYLINYTPQFAGFSNDSDTWSGPEGTGELVILQAAIDGATKEDDPGDKVPKLQAKLDRRESEIIDFATFLFEGPQTVRDVHPLYRTKPFGFNRVSEGWDD